MFVYNYKKKINLIIYRFYTSSEYSFSKNVHKSERKKYEKYGSIVCEEVVPGVKRVSLFRPEDIAHVYQSEFGKIPNHSNSVAAIGKYRKDNSAVFKSGGVLLENDEEWSKLRKKLQKKLSKPQDIVYYIDKIDKVVNQFIELCGKNKYDDVSPLLSRFYLEVMCLVAFDVSLDSFSSEEINDKNSITSKLIEATHDGSKVMMSLNTGFQLWKYFDTPLYKKLKKTQNIIKEFAVEMIDKKLKEINENPDYNSGCLIENYLRDESLDIQDIIAMASDTIIAGINSTSYVTTYSLFHIAKNENVQEKIQQEAEALIPQLDDHMTVEILKNAKYTKATVKETFRLNPIQSGIDKILKHDTIINGYFVPAGTNVLTQNQVISRLEKYFTEPNKFKPDRWLKDNSDSNSKSINGFAVLPFSHGPRSCLAKRLVEQIMHIFLLRVIKIP
ncbi:hypothetical protein HCN44_003908 [Aphidius gifuensis]|uniref:Cytochrome P450 n=1 Tax=Aphidius gifuensis TaxID=684658 RepID=A0A834XX60_APHGI|nr:hypothetical protein HCN44_003908 [Aphidius gifuensis]